MSDSKYLPGFEPYKPVTRREKAVEMIAAAIAVECHGGFNAAGWPIQEAARKSARHALEMMEAHGWGPYFKENDDD